MLAIRVILNCMEMEKKLKIAIVSNNYTPYSGGVVSSINAFSDQMIASGHVVYIITLDFLGDKHNDPAHVIRVPSVAQFKHNKNHCAVPWIAWSGMQELLSGLDPDVVHVQHPFLLCQSALKAARKLSIPVVFTYHTMYERYTHYVPLPQPIVELAVTSKVLRFCKKVDHIIAPSSSIHDYLLRNRIKIPITVIPSPLQNFFLDNSHENKKLERKKFRLLLVSRFAAEKNIKFAIDVFSGLDQGKFVFDLVGYGPQEEDLKFYAHTTLGLKKSQLRFVIKPPRDELTKLYRQADLFIFPSTSDTQGLVLAESMAGGTPVVALDGAGQRDIIKSGENGFIVNSKHKMIKKIIHIANNKDMLKSLSYNAYQTSKNYTSEVLTGQLIELYKNLI